MKAAEPKAKSRAPIPQSVRFNVLRRDNFTCRYCGRSSPDVTLHLDHVKPHSAGGGDTEDNLITSCNDCNFGKGSKVGVTAPTGKGEVGSSGSLVGLFGHTFDDEGAVRYQFRVIRQATPDRYAVQLFSWLTGCPTEIRVWPAEDLFAARLFDNEETWRDYAERTN